MFAEYLSHVSKIRTAVKHLLRPAHDLNRVYSLISSRGIISRIDIGLSQLNMRRELYRSS